MKIVLHIKVYYRLKALLNRTVFNPDLKMSTVLLLRRKEGMLFQSSAAALLNAIPPKVTLFTFGTISKLSLSLRDPRSGLLCNSYSR